MHTSSRRLSAASAACAVALFMAGCADDDDPVATPSEPIASASPTPTAASIDDFCAAKVAIDAAFLAGGPPEEEEEGATPDPAKVGEGLRAAFAEPYAELKRTAQSAVTSDVDTLVSALDDAIADGNGEFFFDPAFAKADAAVDEYLNDNCGFEEVAATAADFEFTGLPTVTPAGLTSLTLTNEGEEFHEMVLMRIADDEDASLEELFELPEEELMSKIQPMGVVLASPSTTATNFFDLRSGRYAVLCFISKGSDAEHDFQGDGPPHFTEGMLEELKVLPGPGEATAEPTSASDADSSSSSSTSEDTESEESASPEPTSSS